jgi:hypothetical protein
LSWPCLALFRYSLTMTAFNFIVRLPLLPVIALYATLASAAAAPPQTYPLNHESESPDKKFSFVLVKGGEADAETLSYGLLIVSTGKVIWSTPSSYHIVEKDDTWPLHNSQEAKVYWNQNSTAFLLDEENYHYTGNAIAGLIGTDSITTHIFELGNLPISGASQWRFQINKGWISPTTLSMKVIGVYDSTATAPSRQFTQNFTCETTDATHFRFVKTN